MSRQQQDVSLERRIKRIWSEEAALDIVDADLSRVLVFCSKSTKVLELSRWLGAYMEMLEESTHASLKLAVLDAEVRIWTVVADFSASVVYSDAIVAHGFTHKLANYGEYCGAPTENEAYEYANTTSELDK